MLLTKNLSFVGVVFRIGLACISLEPLLDGYWLRLFILYGRKGIPEWMAGAAGSHFHAQRC